MNNSNTKFYLHNLENDKASEFISTLLKSKGEILTWEKNSNDIDYFSVISEDKKISKKIILKIKKINSNLPTHEKFQINVLLKATIDNQQYFSNGLLIHDGCQYSVRLNNPIFKGVQRANCRLEASEEELLLRIIVNQTKYIGNDISAGGASFWVPLEDIEQFKKDNLLNDFIMHINKTIYDIPLAKIVCNIKTDKIDEDNVKYNKVALEFIDLPTSIDEKLYRQINSEMRAIAIRKDLKRP